MSGRQYPESPVSADCLVHNGTLPIKLSTYLITKVSLTRDFDAIWVAACALKSLPTADKKVTHKNFLSEVILEFDEDLPLHLKNVFCTGLLFPECPEARELVMLLLDPSKADMLKEACNRLNLTFQVNWDNFPKFAMKKWFAPKHPKALLFEVASCTKESNMLGAGITARSQVEKDLSSLEPNLNTSFDEDYADDQPVSAEPEQSPITEDPLPIMRPVIPPGAVSYEEACDIIWGAINQHKGCHVTPSSVELYLRRYYVSVGNGLAVLKQAVDKSSGVIMTEVNDLIIQSIHESGFYTSKTQAAPVFDISALKDQLEKIVDVPNRIESKVKFFEESLKNIMAYLKSGNRIEPNTMPAVLPVEKPLREETVQDNYAEHEITDLSTLTYRP